MTMRRPKLIAMLSLLLLTACVDASGRAGAPASAPATAGLLGNRYGSGAAPAPRSARSSAGRA